MENNRECQSITALRYLGGECQEQTMELFPENGLPKFFVILEETRNIGTDSGMIHQIMRKTFSLLVVLTTATGCKPGTSPTGQCSILRNGSGTLNSICGRLMPFSFR